MSEIKTTKIIGETGVDAVNFTSGLNVTGISTSTNVSVASSVTAGTFFGNGAGLTGVSAGTLLKKTSYTIARQAISGASFGMDDSIPQRSEGTEFFSQAYTPTNTSNCDLYIYCSAMVRERTNVADDVGMGLFISDQNDALRVVTELMAGYGHGALLYLYHKMPTYSGSKTFSLRAHKANSINYQSLYGGYPSQKFSQAASETLFIIEEVAT